MKILYFTLFMFLFYSCSNEKKDNLKPNGKFKNEKSYESKCNCSSNNTKGNIISNLEFDSTYKQYYSKIDVEESFKCIGHVCYLNESFSVLILIKRINKEFNLKQQNKLIFINSTNLYSFSSDSEDYLPDSVINCNFYFNNIALKLNKKLDSDIIFDNVLKEDVLFSETLAEFGYKNCEPIQKLKKCSMLHP